jgi:uncharacterized protein (TIGR02588 family)
MAAKHTSAKPGKPSTAPPEIPLAEWIAGFIGLLLVGFAVGYMFYSALTGGDRPPDIQVELVSVTPVREGFVARFRATNHGDEPANAVQITGTQGEGADQETSEAVLDFLPAHSHKGGGLFFRRQPAASTLTLRATGYEEP